MSEIRDILDEVEAISREVGRIQLEAHRAGRPTEVQEKGPSDFVTSVDRACEERALSLLGERFPDIPVLAEEGGGTATGSEGRFWCVDPLDGTNNFVHGIPMFCLSIGLVEDGRPSLGVIYDAVHGECFRGGDGEPALLNGEPIRASGRTKLDGAFLATGIPYRKNLNILNYYLPGFHDLVGVCGGIRRCGSAAIDLCYTAAGRFDAFWEFGLSRWDIAAGIAIVRSAGGAVGPFRENEDLLATGNIVAAGSEPLFDLIRSVVTAHLPNH